MRFFSLLFLFQFIHILGYCQSGDSIINDKLVIINIAGFSRDEIAQIIQEVEKKSPKVIGIDAWFTNVKSDTLLVPTLNSFNNIVIAVKLTNCRNHDCDSLTGQYFPYEKQAHVMVNYKRLKYEPALKHLTTLYPFFCLALLNEYDSTIVKKFYRRKVYKRSLRFFGNYESFTTIEGKELLSKEYSHDWNLNGKIVMLGYLGSEIGKVRNPFTETDFKRSALSEGKLPGMYGVILLANIITDIMKRTE